jgi:membrane glycosyltransferase
MSASPALALVRRAAFVPASQGPVPPEDLPPEAPLKMPLQSFEAAPAMARPRPTRALRALSLIAVTVCLTVLAVFALYDVLAVDTVGPLDVMILLIFAPLFAWTAFSFASALAGLLAPAEASDPLGLSAQTPLTPLTSRTAILAPIYNEAPHALFTRLHAIWRSIEDVGAAERFDIFVLSDTTNADIRKTEYEHFRGLRRRMGDGGRLFYRHRPQNTDRKAGNIADWVRRFGGAYDFMVILDADSLMEGGTLVRLAGAMENNPDLGLIQTTPVVINRHSLFARTEQFASRLYGPLLARGIAWWSGDQGNYWGHNAIIRVKAFAEQAGLPHLPGAKPFGGHVLSHDFVEAALLRRAGWAVRMAPGLGGSYEESPPTLADLIARDRRWCQGNLQHLKVLGARGFTWISRLHLLRGVSSYLTAPLWFALLVMSALLPLKPEWGISNIDLANQRAMMGVHPVMSVAAIYGVSISFLLAPKLMAYFATMASPEERRLFGGRRRAFASMMLEILLSALVAPVLMLNQLWALISIVAGSDSGWSAQQREEGKVTFEASANHHLGDTAIGVILGLAAWGAAPQTFWWMLPVILGLVGCIPLATWTASCALGDRALRAGLLVIPEESDPPALVRDYNTLLTMKTPVMTLDELRPRGA